MLPKRIANGEFFVFLHRYDLELNYQLKVSSRRKTLALELRQGQVIVRAPHWLSIEDIESFILDKQDWLMDKLQNQAQHTKACEYRHGDIVLLFGEEFTLHLQVDSSFSYEVKQQARQLLITIPRRVKNHTNYVKSKLKQVYLELAQQYIPARFEYWQQRTGFTATGLELKVFKSRWGCCYSSGLIKLNPMLMGAPNWVIDCVIVHELCHLTHMDHSRQFWLLNQHFCPNCNASKQWLKQYGINLYLA